MKAKVIGTIWAIPLTIVVAASIAYRFTQDESSRIVNKAAMAEVSTAHDSVIDARHDGELAQVLHPTELDKAGLDEARPMEDNGDELAISEADHSPDNEEHMAIRLPSEQIYNKIYRDTLISSFKNGSMTLTQRRDFYTALNHPDIPTEDKKLLHSEYMLAFQQRKITPEQIFGYSE